jgi:hypothetical protein
MHISELYTIYWWGSFFVLLTVERRIRLKIVWSLFLRFTKIIQSKQSILHICGEV